MKKELIISKHCADRSIEVRIYHYMNDENGETYECGKEDYILSPHAIDVIMYNFPYDEGFWYELYNKIDSDSLCTIKSGEDGIWIEITGHSVYDRMEVYNTAPRPVRPMLNDEDKETWEQIVLNICML